MGHFAFAGQARTPIRRVSAPNRGSDLSGSNTGSHAMLTRMKSDSCAATPRSSAAIAASFSPNARLAIIR